MLLLTSLLLNAEEAGMVESVTEASMHCGSLTALY